MSTAGHNQETRPARRFAPNAPVRPPYDSALELALEAAPQLPPLGSDTYEHWQTSSVRDMDAFDQALREAGIMREERTIPGPDGEIELLILRPVDSAGPLAGLFAIHGGGMVLGNRFDHITELDFLRWASEYGMVIVSPEYRLAPDHPAPAAVDDCYASLEWVAANAELLGIDPSRIIVSGVSGGGGLAAGAVLMARDRGGPSLLAQLLICPMLDDRNTTASARQYAAAVGPRVVWPTENNKWAWEAVLGKGHVERDDISPYAAPARATDLSGLPPTYLDSGSAEVFRDEVVDYASRLWAAGTQAELHVWAGGFHSFDLVAPTSPVGMASLAVREDWLRRILDA